jgi:hypothetical protein
MSLLRYALDLKEVDSAWKQGVSGWDQSCKYFAEPVY